jgi:predicted transposase/invertase (TIGR01784 family)
MKPPTPHDALFRETFSDPAHAAGLLRHLLGKPLATRLDWTTLRLCAGSFVDRALRGRHSDLLFTARCGDKDVYLYLLLEHQSTDDPLMAYRLLVYLVRIWERHVREHRGVTSLPAILPLVVHHSKHGWTSPTSFAALYDLEPDALAAFAAHLPDFHFLLDDLRAAGDASLRTRAMTALGRFALFCLRHAPEPDAIVRGLARWLDLIREIRRAEGGPEALELIWRYVFVISAPADPEVLVERLLLVVGEEDKEEIVTAGETLIARGLEKGRAEAHREILLEQLRARFGRLPSSAPDRVQAADTAQVKRWLLRVVTATTLAEVFADP